MPNDYLLLKDSPAPEDRCRKCGAQGPFERAMVERERVGWTIVDGQPRPYYRLICASCKGIVGYESGDRSREIEAP